MKRWLPTVLAGLAVAGVASADQRGLNLAWNDCSSAGTANMSFTCDSNSGLPFVMVASVVAPDSIQKCVSFEVQMDMIFTTASPPSWWQLKTVTGQPAACRNGAMSINADFTSGPFTCTAPWGVAGAGGLASYVVDPFGTQSNRIRIVGVEAVGSSDGAPLTPGTEYYAFKIQITRTKTTGTGSCAGCTDPACIVLNRIGVVQPNGTPGGNQQVYDPPAGGNRAVTWQGGAGADCNLVPTKAKTWGQIKSLYR